MVFWMNIHGCQLHPKVAIYVVKQLKNDSFRLGLYVFTYQHVPKLDLQRQLFYGKNHLNLSIFSFNNLGIQIVQLTFYFLRLCTIFVNSATRLFKKLDNFLRLFSVSANNFESNFDYDYKIQKKSEFQSPRLQNWFYHISSFSPSSATRLMWQAGNKPDWRRSVLCSLAWIAQAWFFFVFIFSWVEIGSVASVIDLQVAWNSMIAWNVIQQIQIRKFATLHRNGKLNEQSKWINSEFLN